MYQNESLLKTFKYKYIKENKKDMNKKLDTDCIVCLTSFILFSTNFMTLLVVVSYTKNCFLAHNKKMFLHKCKKAL